MPCVCKAGSFINACFILECSGCSRPYSVLSIYKLNHVSTCSNDRRCPVLPGLKRYLFIISRSWYASTCNNSVCEIVFEVFVYVCFMSEHMRAGESWFRAWWANIALRTWAWVWTALRTAALRTATFWTARFWWGRALRTWTLTAFTWWWIRNRWFWTTAWRTTAWRIKIRIISANRIYVKYMPGITSWITL